jgi:hypothetical protein
MKIDAAIAGIGASPFGRFLPDSQLGLAARAFKAALDDAGLQREDDRRPVDSYGLAGRSRLRPSRRGPRARHPLRQPVVAAWPLRYQRAPACGPGRFGWIGRCGRLRDGDLVHARTRHISADQAMWRAIARRAARMAKAHPTADRACRRRSPVHAALHGPLWGDKREAGRRADGHPPARAAQRRRTDEGGT